MTNEENFENNKTEIIENKKKFKLSFEGEEYLLFKIFFLPILSIACLIGLITCPNKTVLIIGITALTLILIVVIMKIKDIIKIKQAYIEHDEPMPECLKNKFNASAAYGRNLFNPTLKIFFFQNIHLSIFMIIYALATFALGFKFLTPDNEKILFFTWYLSVITITLIVSIKNGLEGNEWAWKRKKWKSVEEFEKTYNIMDIKEGIKDTIIEFIFIFILTAPFFI